MDTALPLQRAIDDLASLCYEELLGIARRERRDNHDLVTLDTSALVHEAFLRLRTQQVLAEADRRGFLAAAAITMRRVIVDYARRHRAEKRGGGAHPITLDTQPGMVELRADRLVSLDEALEQLAAVEPRLVRVVECRYFCGMTEEETADVLGITARTVRRDWVKARGWLYAALGDD